MAAQKPAPTEAPIDAAALQAEIDRLRGELDSQARRHRAELEALDAQHRQAFERLQEGFRGQEKEFRDAWTRRELEVAALGASAPERGKVLFARHNLRCHTRDGAPLRVPAGAPLPDSVDPKSVPADALEER